MIGAGMIGFRVVGSWLESRCFDMDEADSVPSWLDAMLFEPWQIEFAATAFQIIERRYPNIGKKLFELDGEI